MPGVFIVTDSSCDLEQDDIDSLNIEIVALTIRFGSEEFADRQDISVEDFYRRMADTEDLPETACPSPGAFEQAFRNAVDAAPKPWSVSPSQATCQPHFSQPTLPPLPASLWSPPWPWGSGPWLQ